MRMCIHCDSEIPLARIEVLPNTQTCVSCSTETKRVGFMDWGHKTAPELVIVDSNDKENMRRASRINSRSR